MYNLNRTPFKEPYILVVEVPKSGESATRILRAQEPSGHRKVVADPGNPRLGMREVEGYKSEAKFGMQV